MSDHLRTTSILGSISQGHRAKPCKTLLMLTGLVRLNVEMLYDVVHVHLSFSSRPSHSSQSPGPAKLQEVQNEPHEVQLCPSLVYVGSL